MWVFSPAFGYLESPRIEGDVPPPEIDDISVICGKNRGIQGHFNSCYLDTTLFSMFAFTQVSIYHLYFTGASVFCMFPYGNKVNTRMKICSIILMLVLNFDLYIL